jgi:phage portal protein BeeE
VSVEAQEWAANFYAEGGGPATVIKKAGSLSPELLDPVTYLPDPDGKSEADLLRDQVIGRTPNTAMVIDDTIESIDFKSPSTTGAQMLDARQHQNGEAARMFGVPGSLLEYQQPGSSLTYQNLENEFTKFIRVCLQPLYLEPIEQAMSDLLTRSTVARFNVKGFLRADIKTRFEVHKTAIESGIYDPAYAQREEGITPGDVEYAPVPFAQPQAVPEPIRKVASMRDVRCPQCKRLVTRSDGRVEGRCSHCKLTFLASA